jgi:PAS domain S-box-containing protein
LVRTLDLIALAGALSALCLLALRRHPGMSRDMLVFLIPLLLLTAVHALANTLASIAGLAALRRVEDHVEFLMPLLWFAFLYAYLQDRAHRSLRESEARHRLTMDAMVEPVHVVDRDMRIVLLNSACAEWNRTLGLPSDAVGRPLAEMYPFLSERVFEEYRRVIETREPLTTQEETVIGGRTIVTETHKVPVVSEGEVTRVVTVVRDITEHVLGEKELRQYADRLEQMTRELERSNQDLEDFTHTVSHDLQEPLRKIHTFGQFMLEDFGEDMPEQAREHLSRMLDAAARMKGFIRHLLDLARVGRGGNLVPVEPRKVVEDALDLLSQTVRQCGATVVVAEQMPRVRADPVQLGQVFQNVLGNALKFRSQERAPRIEVAATGDDAWATFSISDNGIGIEEGHLDRIFGIFQRVHPPGRYEGAGVGLALCEKIVRRHGGRIWAESRLGQGTTIHFTLPLS